MEAVIKKRHTVANADYVAVDSDCGINYCFVVPHLGSFLCRL